MSTLNFHRQQEKCIKRKVKNEAWKLRKHRSTSIGIEQNQRTLKKLEQLLTRWLLQNFKVSWQIIYIKTAKVFANILIKKTEMN